MMAIYSQQPITFRPDGELLKMLEYLSKRWHATKSATVRRCILDSFQALSVAARVKREVATPASAD